MVQALALVAAAAVGVLGTVLTLRQSRRAADQEASVARFRADGEAYERGLAIWEDTLTKRAREIAHLEAKVDDLERDLDQQREQCRRCWRSDVT